MMEDKVYCPPLATNQATLIKNAWAYVNLRRHEILPNLLEGGDRERGWINRCQKVIENQRGASS